MLDWTNVQPVLAAVYDLLDERDQVDGADVCGALGREPGDRATTRALMLLREHGLISGYLASGPRVDLIQTTPMGLQRMRNWPRSDDVRAEGVELLLAVLDERIAAAATDDERNRWQRLRDSAASLGASVLGEVLGTWAARVSGAAG